ncbi:uncharacterized protein LOC134843634 isoform X4 [Symsagittifera roscoffensis]|uniref:uncharacterized protein LOC134843634 isoform X4 n=1 Tax=Symsagittifera roscoffensis TaxID=84072 RepID=UPI00307C46AC
MVHFESTQRVAKLRPVEKGATQVTFERSGTLASSRKTVGKAVRSQAGKIRGASAVSGEDSFQPTGPLESMDQRRIRNKAATTQVLDWFLGEWATWQRQGFLCGVAKRCNKTQTNYLLSALEPLFHRDYLLQAGGIYPWRLIGKGKKPLKLQKINGNRYKKTRLLELAKKRMQSNSNPLQNVEPGIAVNLILPQSPAQKKMELNGLRSTDSPDKHPIPKKSAGERVRKISVVEPAGIEISKVQSPRNSSISRTPVDEQILTPDEEKQLGLIAQKSEGRKKWLKLKTVQMIDPSTLLGDKDRGLSIREMLVDGLGVWNGTQLRRSLPGAILGVNKKGMSRGNNKWWVTLPSQHKHFNSKSAMMATTSNSRRVQFEREYTKSSMSFRTENMYTPGGGMERGLPKDKEEMQKMKQEYKRQLRIIYQWMQNLTEVEMGETLGSLVMSAPEGDLRLLTSCLVQRHNERYDVNQLTDSLLLQVFQYLHPRDLSNTAQVCTRWNYLANLDPLWQYHCLNLGKTCGVESLEDLVDAFRLDEPGTNQSALLDEEEPVKISLSSIDWKQAYSELSEAIKEAAAQLGTDDDKPAHILDLDLTDDDVMADTDKEEPTLLDSLRRMRPVIHKMSTGGEDKWYERDNRFRYAHLLNDPILDTVGDIGEEEGEGDLEGLRKEPTSLSDFYDIRSLMDRRKRWKINLPTKEEEDRVNSPAGTQSIFDSLALEMGKMPLDADEKDASERSKGFQLYEESHVDRMSSSQYSEPEMGFLTAAQIKEESLFSFEQREYNQYHEKKTRLPCLDEVARERLEQLKKKRNKLVYVADKLTEKKQKEKEERAKRKRFILTKKKQEEEKEDKSEGTVLKEEELLLMKHVAAELAQDVEEAKSMSRHAGNMSELLHRAQSYLGSLSPSVIDEEDEEGEGKEEEERGEKVEKAVVGQKEIDAEKKRNILEDYVEDAVVRTLNLDRISDSQFSERVKSRVALVRMARHEGEERGADDGMRDGQIGLDVRPPVHQPPEIMSERIVRHYDVQWKYPKKVNPFKGARYTNRILHLHALKILHGHMEAVLCMKISAGRIMTGSMDHSVRVWCNGSGRSLHKLYGHRGSVCSIDFNRIP